MSAESEVIKAEGRFFESLRTGVRAGLESVLGNDFVLIDVMTGSEIPKAVFVDLLASGKLVFESIECLESRVRLYDNTAIVTGQTRMLGHYETQRFQTHSRYTHVYVHAQHAWRLVTAQGTPIVKTVD